MLWPQLLLLLIRRFIDYKQSHTGRMGCLTAKVLNRGRSIMSPAAVRCNACSTSCEPRHSEVPDVFSYTIGSGPQRFSYGYPLEGRERTMWDRSDSRSDGRCRRESWDRSSGSRDGSNERAEPRTATRASCSPGSSTRGVPANGSPSGIATASTPFNRCLQRLQSLMIIAPWFAPSLPGSVGSWSLGFGSFW